MKKSYIIIGIILMAAIGINLQANLVVPGTQAKTMFDDIVHEKSVIFKGKADASFLSDQYEAIYQQILRQLKQDWPHWNEQDIISQIAEHVPTLEVKHLVYLVQHQDKKKALDTIRALGRAGTRVLLEEMQTNIPEKEAVTLLIDGLDREQLVYLNELLQGNLNRLTPYQKEVLDKIAAKVTM